MSTNLMAASRQWATRPDDQRFTSLIELNDFCQHAYKHSASRVVPSKALTAMPLEDNKGLVVAGPTGAMVAPTHWAFGQLASRVKAPAAYLRDLPSPIAADCINYGLKHSRDVEDLGVLLYKNGGPGELRAVSGPNYGRVWNAQITQALVDRFGDGVSGHFRVPGEFGQRVDVTKENTTLYASDRDMFVFLADEERRIELPNRRNGETGSLARGFFVWNSEVGSRSLGIAMFLFDYACKNRIVWGAEQYHEVKIAHTVSAPERWIEEVRPMVETFSQASTAPVQAALMAAQQRKIDDVEQFLKHRFNASQAKAIMNAHFVDEGRPIESLWDVATGVTAYARGIPYQDQRVGLEREAGRILKLAA